MAYKDKEKRLEYKKIYSEINKERIYENNNKWRVENKEYIKEYYQKNKDKKVKYYLKNKEKIAESKKKYYQNNKEEINNKAKTYNKKRKEIDSLFKLKCNTRVLIGNSIKNKGYTKQSKTFKILGCSYEDFKKHLERQFTKGMTWENQGQWHLDHIYPVSLAKDEQEVIKLNHYTNFQPLWAKDNLEKHNKIIPNTQIKLI
jgi:hypothetical protein